jgi:hypothetical protein
VHRWGVILTWTRRRDEWRDVVVLLWLAALTAVAYSDVIGAARGLAFRDHVLVFQPLWSAALESFREGHWPVRPHGVALSAVDQSPAAAFYTPSTALFALAPFEVAYDVFVAFHTWLCAAGVYVFARYRAASRAASAAASAVIAFSGPVISFENLLVGLQCLAWAPWVSWAAARAWSKPGLASVLVLAPLVAFELQAGLVEVVVVQFVVFLYGAASDHSGLRRRLATLVGAVSLAVAMAAIDLGPFLEQLAGARRSDGFSLEERSGWRFVLGSVVELFIPSFWFPPELVAFGVPVATGSPVDPPYLVSLYFGSALALGAAGLGRGRVARWGLAGLAVAMVMAVGVATPVFGWVTSLPVLSSSRYAVKYMIGVSVAVAVLAARAVDLRAPMGRRTTHISLVVGTALVAAYLCLGGDGFRSWLGGAARPLQVGATFEAYARIDIVEVALAAMAGRTVHALVAVLTLAAIARMGRGRAWVPWAIVALVSLDLAGAARWSIRGVPVEEQRPAQPLRERVVGQDQRVYLALPPPVPYVPEQSLFESYAAHRARYGFGHADLRRFEPIDLDGQTGGVFAGAFAQLHNTPPDDAVRLMQRAGVRWVTGAWTSTAVGQLSVADGVTLSELSRTPPYVSTSTRVVVVRTDEERVRLGATLPIEVRMLDDWKTSATTEGCAIQEVSIRRRWDVLADVSCMGPALVMLQEIDGPHWHVTVDDVDVAKLRVDLGFVGARIWAGRHAVRFEYRASSSSWVWCSVLGALTWGVAAGALVARRRR